MKKTAIFIPVVDRIDNIRRIIPNIRANTSLPFTIYVITDNQEIIDYCHQNKVKVFSNGKKTYIERINWLYQNTKEPYFFTGCDDLEFSSGWLKEAMSKNKDVVGVNNTINDLPISFLIKRKYIETQSGCFDFEDVVFCPLYHHYFCDIEMIATARKRMVYGYAEKSIVRHLAKESQAREFVLQDQDMWMRRKRGLKLRI